MGQGSSNVRTNYFLELNQAAIHKHSSATLSKLSQLCVHVCGVGDSIPHADASFHAHEKDARKGDICFCGDRRRLSDRANAAYKCADWKSRMFTSYRWPRAREENINIERKTCFNLVLFMEIVIGFLFTAPLCVCFQSSDSEVRRLSQQLSQRDGALQQLQQLQQERSRLVQLDQVRPQKDAVSNTQLKRKSRNARLQKNTHTHKDINLLIFTLVIKGYL